MKRGNTMLSILLVIEGLKKEFKEEKQKYIGSQFELHIYNSQYGLKVILNSEQNKYDFLIDYNAINKYSVEDCFHKSKKVINYLFDEFFENEVEF